MACTFFDIYNSLFYFVSLFLLLVLFFSLVFLNFYADFLFLFIHYSSVPLDLDLVAQFSVFYGRIKPKVEVFLSSMGKLNQSRSRISAQGFLSILQVSYFFVGFLLKDCSLGNISVACLVIPSFFLYYY